MKMYISGPITGLKQFAQAAKQIEAFGHEPVNPCDNRLPENPSWEDYMVADIIMLFKCDGIYLLKGWEDSKGARIEHFIAQECGIEIINQPNI